MHTNYSLVKNLVMQRKERTRKQNLDERISIHLEKLHAHKVCLIIPQVTLFLTSDNK